MFSDTNSSNFVTCLTNTRVCVCVCTKNISINWKVSLSPLSLARTPKHFNIVYEIPSQKKQTNLGGGGGKWIHIRVTSLHTLYFTTLTQTRAASNPSPFGHPHIQVMIWWPFACLGFYLRQSTLLQVSGVGGGRERERKKKQDDQVNRKVRERETGFQIKLSCRYGHFFSSSATWFEWFTVLGQESESGWI